MRQFHNSLALLLAAAALAAGCSEPAGGQARRSGGPVIAVRTTGVERMAIQRQVDLAGTLMSPDQARVSAEAAGVVRQVLVEIGREVRTGDPLVRLRTIRSDRSATPSPAVTMRRPVTSAPRCWRGAACCRRSICRRRRRGSR